MICVSDDDPSGSIGSVSDFRTAAIPSSRQSETDGHPVTDATSSDCLLGQSDVEQWHRKLEMSEQEQNEFAKSLELARAALYARDPKRRAIEEIERQMMPKEAGRTAILRG